MPLATISPKKPRHHCDVALAVALALALRLADQPRAEARDRRDADRADQARRGPAPRYQGDPRVARGSDAAKASERKLEKARALGKHMWHTAMSPDDRRAYLDKCLEKRSPLGNKVSMRMRGLLEPSPLPLR